MSLTLNQTVLWNLVFQARALLDTLEQHADQGNKEAEALLSKAWQRVQRRQEHAHRAPVRDTTDYLPQPTASIFECFTEPQALYDLEHNTLGLEFDLEQGFSLDAIGFNMNSYEGADNAPLANDKVIALPAPAFMTMKPQTISPARACLLSQTCESELTIWEKKLLDQYRQAA